MENLSTSTNPKVTTVRQTNYLALLFPIGILLFTVWLLLSETFATSNSESASLLKVVAYWFVELCSLGVIIYRIYHHKKLTVEEISAVALATSIFSNEFINYFQIPALSFLPLLMFDVMPILMIITLTQGKTFYGLSLHQNKRIIVR